MAEQKLPKLIASAVFRHRFLKTARLTSDSRRNNLKMFVPAPFAPEILAEIERLTA